MWNFKTYSAWPTFFDGLRALIGIKMRPYSIGSN